MKQSALIILFLIIACKSDKQNINTNTNSIQEDSIVESKSIEDDSLKAYLKNLDLEYAIEPEDTLFLKAEIATKDSTLWVGMSKYVDHRIIGYQKPDVHSKRLIMISCWTKDVKDNPFKLKYGAHYSTTFLDSITLKFQKFEGGYGKIKVFSKDKFSDIVFIEKRFLEFEPEY